MRPRWTDFLDPEGLDGAYLPWKKAEARVGISRTTAWRLQKTGDFPKPYVMSPGRVAYRESEVEAWKASRGHRSAETTPRVPTAKPVEPAPAPPEPTTWSPPPQSSRAAARPARASTRARSNNAHNGQMTFDF